MDEYYVLMGSKHGTTLITSGDLCYCQSVVDLLNKGNSLNSLDSFWIEDGIGRSCT